MTGVTLGPACGVFGCVVGGAGGLGADITAAADSVGARPNLDESGPVYRCRCQNRWSWRRRLGHRCHRHCRLSPIVIELMDSELTAVGGIRVVDRSPGTDGERDTTSVAVTAGAVMGTDPEKL